MASVDMTSAALAVSRLPAGAVHTLAIDAEISWAREVGDQRGSRDSNPDSWFWRPCSWPLDHSPKRASECRCGREDSNLHGPLKAHQDLNLGRLPVPPR